ncbi:MAG TPA: ROK family protein [Ignavibacteriaceae bacterium]|nr:ROK family protein [Ignavibacteriaceae bacterium]
MGGTKILAAAINSHDGIIARVKKETPAGNDKEKYIQSLAEIVEEVVNELHLDKSNVKAVCLGVPGAVNPFTGIINIAPNLKLKNFNIGERLHKLIPYPVLIENDVNLGALGIKTFGVGKNAKNLFVVFIGTGIGGGIILNEKIYRGSNFVAGEIGHMVVEKDGPLCGCGNKGCIEAVASRTAIVRNIEKDIKQGKKSLLSGFVKNKEKIKSKALASAIKNNDAVAVKRLNEACERIGILLAGVCNLLNVDMIVLGGGVIEAVGKYMMPKIKKSFNENVMSGSAKGLKIVPSKLGDDAALYGGIPLAEEFLDVKV